MVYNLIIVLILGAKNCGVFTGVPSWLQCAYMMDLRPLTDEGALRLAQNILGAERMNTSCQRAIRDAKGNPRVLIQLLLHPYPCLPPVFVYIVKRWFTRLSAMHQLVCKIAAVLGDSFTEAQVLYCLYRYRHLEQPVDIYHLVVEGLFKANADQLSFQHGMLQQAIYSQVSSFEKRHFENLKSSWLSQCSTLSIDANLTG